MENKKIMAIAILAFVIGFAAYSAAGTSIQDITVLITNYTVNISGAPAIMHYATFIPGSNVTLVQDTNAHSITINAEAGNITLNQTNWFDEIYVNKISLNDSAWQNINLNSSVVLSNPEFYLYTSDYLSYFRIQDSDFKILSYDAANYSILDMRSENENYLSLEAGNSTEGSVYDQYGSYFTWTVNGDRLLQVDANKVTLNRYIGSDQYLKVNTSGELYKVTPVITVESDYTNLTRLVGTVYTNTYDCPIYLNIRVGCFSTVGNTECNIRLLNNNTAINQHYLNPMGVNQYYIHTFANLIPASTNYSLVNNGTAQLLLYSWYENNMTVQP